MATGKFRLKFGLTVLAVVTTFVVYYLTTGLSAKVLVIGKKPPVRLTLPSDLHIAAVSCGSKTNETALMVKSALIFASVPIFFHIFTDSPAFLIAQVYSFNSGSRLLTFATVFIQSNFQLAKNICGNGCLSHVQPNDYLFQQAALKGRLDAFIYVDSDVLFLSPPESLWRQFGKFTRSQSVALGLESEDAEDNWYRRFGRVPFYEPYGLNSGLLLMNLTRLRRSKWNEKTPERIYQKYKSVITWGDQDIFNIFFHFHPEMVMPLGCEWNFRPDHCLVKCKNAADGRNLRVLHGSRESFLIGRYLGFQAIFQAFHQYRLGQDLQKNLLSPMQRLLERLSNRNSTCELDFQAIPEVIRDRLSNGWIND